MVESLRLQVTSANDPNLILESESSSIIDWERRGDGPCDQLTYDSDI